MSGNFEGIGIQFRIEKIQYWLCIQFQIDHQKTGILAGDRIVEVDGEGIAE